MIIIVGLYMRELHENVIFGEFHRLHFALIICIDHYIVNSELCELALK